LTGTVERIQQISGKKVAFYQVDLMDRQSLDAVFEAHKDYIEGIIHLAGTILSFRTPNNSRKVLIRMR
jgi:UDP-glucose 4-epimerase